MKRVSFGRPSFGRRCMFERKKTERPEESASESAYILDLIDLERYRDHFYDYLAINEDYYLPEEEVREYYVPGSNLRKYFVVRGEHVQLQGGQVLVDGGPVGELKTSDEEMVEGWQDREIIKRMEVFLGGGAFKQIRLREDRVFDWEKNPGQAAGGRGNESAARGTQRTASAGTGETKDGEAVFNEGADPVETGETKDGKAVFNEGADPARTGETKLEEAATDEGSEERIEVRDRRIPYYAYLYLELKGSLSAGEVAKKRSLPRPSWLIFRRKPKLRRARSRGKRDERASRG